MAAHDAAGRQGLKCDGPGIDRLSRQHGVATREALVAWAGYLQGIGTSGQIAEGEPAIGSGLLRLTDRSGDGGRDASQRSCGCGIEHLARQGARLRHCRRCQ